MTTFALLILLTHDWYDPECCNKSDCHPVPCAEIVDGRWRGLTANSTRRSQDAGCHVCIAASGRGKFYCIYVPEVTS